MLTKCLSADGVTSPPFTDCYPTAPRLLCGWSDGLEWSPGCAASDALSRPPVTSHLMFSNRALSITAPRLWNDLPPELRTISSPPLPSLPITRHHLHLPPLSVTPRTFHSKLKSHLFNLSYPAPSDHPPPPSQQPPP